MLPDILLVNPPIYDFTAYDFWLKPYGLLSVAGYLRNKAKFRLFDSLDRLHPFMAEDKKFESDDFGRGKFFCKSITHPPTLSQIPRYFRRIGLPQSIFQSFLMENRPSDFAIIQTSMTYWYQGVEEIIRDIRKLWPSTKIILGGNYVTLCPEHAKTLNADLLVYGNDLSKLWEFLKLEPDLNQPPLWEAYEKLETGILKLTEGCPFKCTYCSVANVYSDFKVRPLERSFKELDLLLDLGVKNIAFYDDALLYRYQDALIPFLEYLLKRNVNINLHTPNAINARFLTKPLAQLMSKGGFKTFYLGFESFSKLWQKNTGSKVEPYDLETAVNILIDCGTNPNNITAYQILGHPFTDLQQLEDTMHFVNNLGIRGHLSDFSPIPGTPDGEYCRKWVNLDEPLMHNKTAFPSILLGFDNVNRLKDLQRQLNKKISEQPDLADIPC